MSTTGNIDLYRIANTAAIKAGKKILEIYNTADFGVEMKDNNSPLTIADKAGHDVIMEHLQQTNIPVLSEEGRDIPYSERSQWPRFWMVDPLDGTKEFIKRNGEFTVNIALIEGGVPVFGSVYVPVTDTLFWGGQNNPGMKVVGSNETPLSKSDGLRLDQKMLKAGQRVVASRSHLNEDTQKFVDQLDQPDIVSMGSSLKFMALADGQADIYPRFAPTMEWDTAAAHGVLLSLGYHVMLKDLSGPLKYNKQDLLNPYFISY